MIGTVSFPTSQNRTTGINSLFNVQSKMCGPQNWVLGSKSTFPLGGDVSKTPSIEAATTSRTESEMAEAALDQKYPIKR